MSGRRNARKKEYENRIRATEDYKGVLEGSHLDRWVLLEKQRSLHILFLGRWEMEVNTLAIVLPSFWDTFPNLALLHIYRVLKEWWKQIQLKVKFVCLLSRHIQLLLPEYILGSSSILGWFAAEIFFQAAFYKEYKYFPRHWELTKLCSCLFVSLGFSQPYWLLLWHFVLPNKQLSLSKPQWCSLANQLHVGEVMTSKRQTKLIQSEGNALYWFKIMNQCLYSVLASFTFSDVTKKPDLASSTIM